MPAFDDLISQVRLIYRDYQQDGVITSGANEPSKSALMAQHIRLIRLVGALSDAVLYQNVEIHETLTLLEAVSGPSADDLGLVWGDGANNGMYVYDAVTPEWVNITDSLLPSSLLDDLNELTAFSDRLDTAEGEIDTNTARLATRGEYATKALLDAAVSGLDDGIYVVTSDATSGDNKAYTVVSGAITGNFSDEQYRIIKALRDGLATRAPLHSPTFTGTVSGIAKAMVGLGNVDNTADAAKPVSVAQQAALDAKAGADELLQAGLVEPGRPGEALTRFSRTLTGAPSARTPMTAGTVVVSDDFGAVLEIGGEDVPGDPGYLDFAERIAWAMTATDLYRVTWICARAEDPLPDTEVELRPLLQHLDKAKAHVSLAEPVGNRTPLEEDGPVVISRLVTRDSAMTGRNDEAGNPIHVVPSATRFLSPGWRIMAGAQKSHFASVTFEKATEDFALFGRIAAVTAQLEINGFAPTLGTAELGGTYSVTLQWTVSGYAWGAAGSKLELAVGDGALGLLDVETTEQVLTGTTGTTGYTLRATDADGAVVEVTTQFRVLQKVYWGVAADPAALNSAAVLAGSSAFASNHPESIGYATPGGAKPWYAFPFGSDTEGAVAFGDVDQFFTQIGAIGMLSRDLTVTNGAGFAQSYRLYYFEYDQNSAVTLYTERPS